DGAHLAIYDTAGHIILWDMEKNKQLFTFAGTPGWYDHLYFSADGKRLGTIVGSDEQTISVMVFDVQTGSVVRKFPLPILPKNWTFSAFNHDMTRIIVGVT